MTQEAPCPSIHTMTGKTHVNRQRQYVHVQARELGYDERTYRNELFNLTGKGSAKNLNRRELAHVIDVFDERVSGKSERTALPKPGTPEFNAQEGELASMLAGF